MLSVQADGREKLANLSPVFLRLLSVVQQGARRILPCGTPLVVRRKCLDEISSGEGDIAFVLGQLPQGPGAVVSHGYVRTAQVAAEWRDMAHQVVLPLGEVAHGASRLHPHPIARVFQKSQQRPYCGGDIRFPSTLILNHRTGFGANGPIWMARPVESKLHDCRAHLRIRPRRAPQGIEDHRLRSRIVVREEGCEAIDIAGEPIVLGEHKGDCGPPLADERRELIP